MGCFRWLWPTLTGDLSLAGQNICLRDILSGTTRVVSTNRDWFSSSSSPRMSADGRFIAYKTGSYPSNIEEMFVADAQLGTITRINGPCSRGVATYTRRISGDGRFLVFSSSDIDVSDGEFRSDDSNIFRWDRLSGATTLISVNTPRTGGASGWETLQALSHDGNVIAFTSQGPDLVFGDTNDHDDVFIWQAGALPQLSISISNGMVTITWPMDSPPAVLETRTSNSDWSTVTGSMQQQAGNYLYQTPVGSDPVRFFQLRLL